MVLNCVADFCHAGSRFDFELHRSQAAVIVWYPLIQFLGCVGGALRCKVFINSRSDLCQANEQVCIYLRCGHSHQEMTASWIIISSDHFFSDLQIS